MYSCVYEGMRKYLVILFFATRAIICILIIFIHQLFFSEIYLMSVCWQLGQYRRTATIPSEHEEWIAVGKETGKGKYALGKGSSLPLFIVDR